MRRASHLTPLESSVSISTRQLQMVDLPPVVPGAGQEIKGQRPAPEHWSSSQPGELDSHVPVLPTTRLYLSRCILTESGSWHVWAFPKGARGWIDGTEGPHALVTLT